MSRFLSLALAGTFLVACQKPIAWNGQALAKPIQPPELALVDQKDETLRWQNLHDKVMQVNFGYSRCPDICPLALGHIKNAVKALGDKADRVAVVWVTIDPERDTPAYIRKYLALLDDRFIVVTGEVTEIDKLAKVFGVHYKRVLYDGNADGYAFQHSPAAYVVDRRGHVRLIHGDTGDSQKIVEDVRHLL